MTPEDQEQVREIVAAAEHRLKDHAEKIARDLQTEVLRIVEGSARANFARLHAIESVQGDLSIRLAELEERVLYFETRRNRPQ